MAQKAIERVAVWVRSYACYGRSLEATVPLLPTYVHPRRMMRYFFLAQSQSTRQKVWFVVGDLALPFTPLDRLTATLLRALGGLSHTFFACRLHVRGGERRLTRRFCISRPTLSSACMYCHDCTEVRMHKIRQPRDGEAENR